MGIQERIEKIKEYFGGFNIADDVCYVLVKFPKEWKMPDAKLLKEEFSTELAPDPDGIFFYTGLDNGPDTVFDAVDYVVELNHILKEKNLLFQKKFEELKELFVSETDINVLRTLKFTFEKKEEKKETPKKSKAVAKKETQKKDNKGEKVEEPKEPIVVEENNNEKESSMMALVETMTE